MAAIGLVGKIARGLRKKKDLANFKRGLNLIAETAAARIELRACQSVGIGARVAGRLRVENRGVIRIGSGFSATSTYVPSELLSQANGTIEIGDDVWLNFGTVISSSSSVRIGSRVMIGPHCIVSDTLLPEAEPSGRAGEASPVEIGDDVWLAGRVTVAPGVKIGAGAVITAGSIVTTDIPPKAMAGGIPARVLRYIDESSPSTKVARESSLEEHDGAPEIAAKPPAHCGTLISDFTVDELADELLADGVEPPLAAQVAPFGQVIQSLMQTPAPDARDFAVVWTLPQSMIPAFSRVLTHEEIDPSVVQDEVDQFAALVARAASQYKVVFVPTWVLPAWVRGRGMCDARDGGVLRTLLAMNLRLMAALETISNVYVLDAQRWLSGVGSAAQKTRGWYLGKVAFGRAVMREAAADVRAAFAGLNGAAKKLLVLDLDDTLWGGVVGDVGWENLRLGGPDARGESFRDFQLAVKSLKQRGILLALVSKNEESVALEAIRKHPEMVLEESDFVAWRINWTDKAANIASLVAELNLGLGSVVFIDDNPAERARVKEALPEVFVPDWPGDDLLSTSAFGRLRCFDAPAITREDLARTRLYAEERQRDQLQQQVGSVDEWLKSLGIKLKAERLNAGNLQRVVQLLNKTNQLNLTTRRLNETELLEWANTPNRSIWAISVADRFGDAGLTGVVSIEVDAQLARIVDYVLSCRVMGRKIEEAMLHVATAAAIEAGALRLEARYVETPKNKPCLRVLSGSALRLGAGDTFHWESPECYPLPEMIELQRVG